MILFPDSSNLSTQNMFVRIIVIAKTNIVVIDNYNNLFTIYRVNIKSCAGRLRVCPASPGAVGSGKRAWSRHAPRGDGSARAVPVAPLINFDVFTCLHSDTCLVHSTRTTMRSLNQIPTVSTDVSHTRTVVAANMQPAASQSFQAFGTKCSYMETLSVFWAR